MIGLFFVITFAVYFGIRMALAQPGEYVAPKPVGRFLDRFLTFLSISVVAFVVCCALFGFAMAMQAASAADLPRENVSHVAKPSCEPQTAEPATPQHEVSGPDLRKPHICGFIPPCVNIVVPTK